MGVEVAAALHEGRRASGGGGGDGEMWDEGAVGWQAWKLMGVSGAPSSAKLALWLDVW